MKMSPWRAVVAVAVSLLVAEGYSMQWPVPYQRFDSRPPSNPFCKALYPFCPTGYSDGHIPVMDDDDTLEVFVLKAPVWEFKFGKLLDYFHIIHDAVGFRSMKTGLNYTNEWYELFQFFNCTFPHVMKNWTSPLWCNQGAACFYPGIDDRHWKQNGTLQKVAEMTGAQFNELAAYIKWDNHTGLFYDTWRVRNSTGSDYMEWFSPHECANYVIRLFQKMSSLGANFTTTYKVNYTYLSLYSDMPILLGNESSIFGPNGNKTLAAKMLEFYSYFQAHQPVLQMLESLVHIYDYIVFQKEYYFYFNSQYWLLPMKKPYMRVSYEYEPFASP